MKRAAFAHSPPPMQVDCEGRIHPRIFDLFSSIPTLDGSKTVTREILEWNETMKTSSKSRLFRDDHRGDSPKVWPKRKTYSEQYDPRVLLKEFSALPG